MKRNFIGIAFMGLGTFASVFNTYTAYQKEGVETAMFWGLLGAMAAWGTYVEAKEGGFIKPWF